MGAFARFSRVIRSSAVRVGERVRIVEMNGCMAHVRGRVQAGTVIGISSAPVYGDWGYKIPWADIKLDEGYITKRSAEPRLWTRHEDGTMEHLI
jgi:hypothetical protein